MGLTVRERVPELMDDPGIDPGEHRRALAGLARINRWSGTVGGIWRVVRELAKRGPVRVLDVATGSGDVPVGIRQRADAAGLAVEIDGCDVSPTAVAEATKRAAGVRFFTHDAVADPLPGGYDVVTCSLFLHHLSDDDAVRVLRHMAAAGRTVVVNDLARSRLNYGLVWVACHALTRSKVVRFDGPASVRSAFTPAEAVALAERAGLTGATVALRFPCRFLLTWTRP